jgi:hypothetical protein
MLQSPVYISGAITNNKSYINEFLQVSARLSSKGFIVKNPCTIPALAEDTNNFYKEWCYYMIESIKMLRTCNSMVVIDSPGVKESGGVQIEIEVANALGIPIKYYEL